MWLSPIARVKESKVWAARMVGEQKILIKWWLIMAGLFSVAWLFQGDSLITRGTGFSVVLYAIWNVDEIRKFEGKRPTPMDVLRESKAMQFWTIGTLGIEIGTAVFFLLSGRNLGEYIGGFGSLVFVILVPILPPLLVSQLVLYRNLGKAES
ncbi:MAG: hypothetical protein FIA97_06140 [Methylococcaceae bacterium]|nr:hypothetical protein [Methylococcaceae bacterium]